MRPSIVLAASAVLLCGCRSRVAVVTVDPSIRHQTITGWESTVEVWWPDSLAPHARVRDSLAAAAAELGLTRLRLVVRAGFEHERDWYAEYRAGRIDYQQWRCKRHSTVNDNDDPRRLDERGFHWAELDDAVEQQTLPLRDALAARGESLAVVLTYVAFIGQTCDGTPWLHGDPEEYAEFAVATVRHLRQKYRLEPTAWEVILEADNAAPAFRGGTLVGRALAETARRLGAEGFRGHFIAPSTMRADSALPYYDALVAVAGAREAIGELSYHRYGSIAPGTLDSIGARGRRDSVNTSMLEHIRADHRELYEDLTRARVSAWQQFVLAYPIKEDNGAQHFLVDSAGRVRQGWRSRFLRQYFRGARPGAVRIGATTDDGGVRPVAFVNRDGRVSVVVQADRLGEIVVRGLPAGTYQGSFATAAVPVGSMPDVTVLSGGELRFKVWAAGVYSAVTVRSP